MNYKSLANIITPNIIQKGMQYVCIDKLPLETVIMLDCSSFLQVKVDQNAKFF